MRKITSYLFDKHSLFLVKMKIQHWHQPHWFLKMKQAIWHMITGAGSLLDISGHSKVSEPQWRSTRIKLEDNSFYTSPMSDFINALSDIQNCTSKASKAMNMVMDQSTCVPEEGRKAVQSWLDACQQERNRFKAYVDEGFTGMEKYITKGKKRSKKRK